MPLTTPTPTTIRSTNPDGFLHLLIGELAALRRASPDEFRALGTDMVDDFIAAHGSEGMAADAHYLKTCFADSNGDASPKSGWDLKPSDTAGFGRLEILSRDSPDQTNFPGNSSFWDTVKYNPAFQGRQMRTDSLKFPVFI